MTPHQTPPSVTEEMVERAAQALYRREAERAGVVSVVLTKAAGKLIEYKMDPYEGNEETWRDEARAALAATRRALEGGESDA
jgi:hypothetical protein